MLEAYLARYRYDLVERVIPFWERHGIDAEYGGFFSGLDRDGSLYDDRKYLWLQGRAVWMFSRLYRELEPRPAWLEAARQGAAFIRRHGRDPRGRIYFSLARDGRPLAFQRKPYAAVFVQMGLFEYGRAAGDQGCLDESVELFWQIVDWVADPTLLDRYALPGQIPMSNLADLLVVGLMALDLARHTGEQRYADVVAATIAGVSRHYDPARRIFRENIARDGRAIDDLPEGRIFNPGHAIETAWILLQMLELQPDPALAQVALDAMLGSLELGWDEPHGGILYFVDLQGRPTLQLEATMKLWWPHAEAIYALVLASTRTRNPAFLGWLERVDAYTYRHFVDAEHGEWFGYCERDGSLALTSKGGNYKGFFHVPRALLFSIQAIEQAGRA